MTNLFPFLAAIIAASLQRFFISAPLKPGVSVAILLAYSSILDSESMTIGFKWTKNISFLPSKSGRSTSINLSNLPGLVRAGSRTYFWLVAAKTITFEFASKPSISTRSWFRVLSLSSLPPPNPPEYQTNLLVLFFPTASISSIKIIEGEASLAYLNKSLTLCAPTPTYISINSLPLIVKKGTLLSPAHALAIMVLPVPGGPVNKAPLGIFAPSLWYFWGFTKKSMNYTISSFAFCIPTTSLNLTLMVCLNLLLFDWSIIEKPCLPIPCPFLPAPLEAPKMASMNNNMRMKLR